MKNAPLFENGAPVTTMNDGVAGASITTPSPTASASQKLPDLQLFIALNGGYDLATPDDWAWYDHAVSQWHSARIAQLRDMQAGNTNWLRTPLPRPRRRGRP